MNDDKVYLILSSLSSKFDPLISALESLESSKLNLSYVTARLLDEEARFVRCELEAQFGNVDKSWQAAKSGSCANSDGSTTAHNNFKAVASSRNEESSVAMQIKRCHGCGSTEHLVKSCPAGRRSRGKKKLFSTQKQQASLIVARGFTNKPV